jgi:hypothetical protein
MKLTDIQEKWLTALESGEYQQTKHALHRPEKNEYCCLGVACKLVLGDPNDTTSMGTNSIWLGNVGKAPCPVVDALGLYGSCGEIENDSQYDYSLAEMNDDGKSFKEIAAYIRANPENVFRPST